MFKPIAVGLFASLSLFLFSSADALIAKPPVNKGEIELKLSAASDTFTIDYAGKSAKEYRQWLEELQAQSKKGTDRDLKLPAPIKVDLTLEFVNNTEKEVVVLVGGDYTLDLELKGPAAFIIKENVAYTDDIKRPTPVTLAAGKSHKIMVPTLQCGFRGYGAKAYWAEPGEYTLTATYSTRSPNAAGEVFKSSPLKLKVVEPGKKEPGLKPKFDIQPLPSVQPLPINRPAVEPAVDPVKEKEPVKKELLELSIEAPQGGDTFKLDLKAANELKKELDAILEDAKNKKLRDRIPVAPAVDFNLVIKNSSDKDMDIYVGGDDSRITLKLEGPGAVHAQYLVIQTADFRFSKRVTVEAGKTYTVALKSLEHGPRGVGNRWYWTQPGNYTLTAEWQLGGPQGKQGAKLVSAPLRLKVEEDKK